MSHQGWQEVLLPWLKDKVSHSWVDPRSAETDKDLLYKYKLGWALAQSCSEIMEFVDQSIETTEALTKKEKGEETNKLREAVS